MKRFLVCLAVVTVFLLCAVVPWQQIAAPLLRPKLVIAAAPENEVRALWVVRDTLTSPESITAMIGRAKTAKFNTLIVQVRGRGDAYYNSRWEPRTPLLADQIPEFDPLEFTIKEAHAAGLKVHAWLNTFLVADLGNVPEDPNHVINKHPEWLAVPRGIASDVFHGDTTTPTYLERIISYSRANNSELEGLFLSPAHPGVKEHIYNLWIDIVERYDVDGLHFDYIRYPNRQYDFSRTSLERFRAEVDKTLRLEDRQRLNAAFLSNPLAYVNEFPDRYEQFQRDQVTDLVERIYQGVKIRKPDALVSAAVFANDKDAFDARRQDWKQWLQRGILDVACPMAYSTETSVFQRQINIAVNSRYQKNIWAGIGSWQQPVNGTLEKISAARELGAQGFVLFSYDSAVKSSELNPNADYLNRVRDALDTAEMKANR
ncbi:MAG TPA: family 10 glycosylhydrolase [Blastocatellia bacterium]|nr:family 10 glycosylhydrolase [Blastocatellia bacterium]